jgi:hypothetical protein
MATQLTVLSHRIAGQAVLTATNANIDGDQSIVYNLPVDWGNSILLEAYVQITTIATLMTTPEFFGPQITMVDNSETNNVDFVGIAPWIRITADELGAAVLPDQPRYWDRREVIAVRFEEVDTNVAPTADLRVFFLVKRLAAT